MTITQAEFLRLLPAAVGGAAYRVEGDEIVHGDAGGGWRIVLTPLPELVLGLVRLERYRVIFSFAGYEAGEIAAFFRRFDLHFARGGG